MNLQLRRKLAVVVSTAAAKGVERLPEGTAEEMSIRCHLNVEVWALCAHISVVLHMQLCWGPIEYLADPIL